MFVIMLVLSVVLALAVGAAGAGKVVQAPAMVAGAEHLGFSTRAFRMIGALELAAVPGLLIGVFWVPLGILTAACVAVLLALAARAHARAGDPFPVLAPAILLAVAAAVTAGVGIARI